MQTTHRSPVGLVGVILLSAVAFVSPCSAEPANQVDQVSSPTGAQIAFFEQKIQPILTAHCSECHTGAKAKGGLRLESRSLLRKGGDSGPVIVPGHVDESLLLAALRHEDLKMPPKGKLSDTVIADFKSWIRDGAVDPRPIDAPAEKHWSLRPRSRPEIPRVSRSNDPGWVQNPIDAFILDRLQRSGLEPAPAADRRTLIRRVSYDLIGLPPTPEEIAAFASNNSPRAYEQLIDRLLESPHYGERWGQHWLDVVRYAETEGYEYDGHRSGAWRYRDYVIRSFNADKPFDQFVREQLAGDELDPTNHEYRVAAGFHRLGPVRRNAGNKKVAFSRNEVLTERTDALGSAFLGLTLGCARCHDHRFDDIPQTDYYRLQAFLAASHDHDWILADEAAQSQWKTETEKITAQIKELQKQRENRKGTERVALDRKIASLRESLPTELPTISTVQNRAEERTPIHVLRRGDMEQKSSRVGPRVLSALVDERVREMSADVSQPRSELARWINDPEHPLTARVYVNRVWQGHFGRGLVATPNDFGVNGSLPSHVELLDYLANEFIAEGRRLRPLHRLILTSSTYRQSVASPQLERGRKIDPENHLLWHFPRRRLSAEEVRDSLLSIAGRLNFKSGGPSVIVRADLDLVNLLYDPSQWTVTPDEAEHRRRSVYLLAKRNLRLPFAQAFDQPDLQISCPRRESSTHALQALELLNGSFSNEMARWFSERLQRESGEQVEAQIDRAFRLIASRPPVEQEQRVARSFLDEHSLKEFALALFNLNAFMYID